MPGLFFYSVLLFACLTMLFCPAGWVLAERSGAPERFRSTLSFGLGALWNAALLFLCLASDLSRPGTMVVLYGSAVAMFGLWLHAGGARELLTRGNLPVLLFMLAYYLLSVVSSAFPNAELHDVSGETTRLLSDLPIDNIIPYNFSRYLVEGIPFSAVDAVPDWPAAARGPLSGTLAANVFIMLGAEERGGWLATSPGTFFIFQCVLTYLNVLAAVAVWALGAELASRRAAAWALFAIAGTSFWYTNILFSWPKFFMAYYVLCAMLLWRAAEERIADWFLCGVFLGAALLVHESAALYAAPLFFVLTVSKIGEYLRARQEGQWNNIVRRYHALRCASPPGALVLGAVLLLLPWLKVKQGLGESSARMLYLHLFCIKDQSISSLSLGEALQRYLREHSWWEIAATKASNLFYPFDLSHSGARAADLLLEPYRFFAALEPVSFFQLIFAVGPLMLLVALFPLISKRAGRSRDEFRALILVGLGALAAGALAFGCPQSTWNHHWAYPLFLLLLLCAGWSAAEGPWWCGLLFVLGWIGNLLVLLIRAWFPASGAVPLHASRAYLISQSGCILLLMLVLAYAVIRNYERDDESIF